MAKGKYIRTPEIRKKLSLANSGKTYSHETKEKMRVSHIGKTHSPETRAKISASNRGKTLSEETKTKLSISHLGKFVSDITKEKLRLRSTGKKHTPETLQKIRASKLGAKNPNYGRPLSKEHREKIRANLPDNSGINNPRYGIVLSEQEKQNLSRKTSGTNNPMFGRQHSPESKRKQRVTALKRMFRDGTIMSIGKNEKALLNKQEQLDRVTILRQHHIKYLGYITDGYCPETNTVYEVYERRHLRPKVAARDAIRQKEIEKYLGCKFVIIWDR